MEFYTLSKKNLINKQREFKIFSDTTGIREFCDACDPVKGRPHAFVNIASFSHHLIRTHKEQRHKEYVQTEIKKLKNFSSHRRSQK